MERLTFEGCYCDIAQCSALPCPYEHNCTEKQVWTMLKEYEDTGLSPVACAQARRIEDRLNEGGSSIKTMVELMVAYDEGRVTIAPKKKGEEI